MFARVAHARRSVVAKLQITVDDGPLPVKGALTPILAELAKRKVVAAFFNLGEEVHRDPASAISIKSMGHVLGNHSWDHLMPSTAKFTDEQIVEQFRRSHSEVKAATGFMLRHWRAPRLQQISRLTRLLVGSNKLYTLSHCDVHADSKDSQGVGNASGMLAALRNDIRIQPARQTFRLLFHVKLATAAALPTVLDGLVADGHTLVDFAQVA
jgi:peptidoglycan/xylan/chitin deacetylase (PgdA/CDA1 family)